MPFYCNIRVHEYVRIPLRVIADEKQSRNESQACDIERPIRHLCTVIYVSHQVSLYSVLDACKKFRIDAYVGEEVISFLLLFSVY